MTRLDELLVEAKQQLTEGNGKETTETRGMTLREIVLEMREDVKELKELSPTFVTRRELYSVVVGLITLIGLDRIMT